MKVGLPASIPDVYANTVVVWHSPHEFTLECGVLPAHPGSNALALGARIRIPTTVIFHLARAIADNISQYEDNYGKIKPIPEVEVPEGFADYGPEDESDDEDGHA